MEVKLEKKFTSLTSLTSLTAVCNENTKCIQIFVNNINDKVIKFNNKERKITT